MNVLGTKLRISCYKALNSSNTLFRNATFKSVISLENLYPNSSLKLTTPSKPEQSESVKFSGYIPIDKLDITYSRSSGPGGQNVNKVNTKVDIRFHLQSAEWLSNEAKQKLLETFKEKITKEGYLIFKSDLTRFQHLNVADCLEKIRNSVRLALAETQQPSPETQEKIRRRLERAARERLLIKRERSQVKNDRQAPNVF